MHESYEDITDIAGAPDWFDQRGTPRYGEFHPSKVGVYHHEAVLYAIRCQDCNLRVRVVSVPMSASERLLWKTEFGGADLDDSASFADAFLDPETLHYGDPPANSYAHTIPGCAGATMNSIDEEVLEWWRLEGFTWQRHPEFEGGVLYEDLPDQE